MISNRPLIAFLLVTFATAATRSAELATVDRQIVRGIEAAIHKAGSAYGAGQPAVAGESLADAIGQLDVAMQAASPELFDALRPMRSKLLTVHALIELEGVSLPPVRDHSRPGATSAAEPEAEPPMQPDAPDRSVSFVSDVAPMLIEKCGRCHIQGARGNFAMPSFATLMKGPPVGVVVFPGDPVASRLVETIESGDMPRGGGRVSAEQLTALKSWIAQGAKFDGPAADAPLDSLVTAGPPANAQTPMVTAKAATGSETVSFASQIAPLLIDNCTGCHIDAMNDRGGLRMDTLAQLLRGGDSGAVVAPGRGENSLLVQKLRGSAGDRMPAGGRPPLSEDSIQLVSTWIDEGATIDVGTPAGPIRSLAAMAWLQSATPPEITQRRVELSHKHFALAAAGATPKTIQNEHFIASGTVSESTLKTVLAAAEKALERSTTLVPKVDNAEAYFGGKAAIYVLPQRYDYSELTRMVEGRSVPTDWQSHWRYDGIAAYVAVVAGGNDEPDVIEDRLLAPITSLVVASRSMDVPAWLAEGVGRATATPPGRASNASQSQKVELARRIGSLKDASAFLEGKLPPDAADAMSGGIASTMLDRTNRRKLTVTLRAVAEGTPFDQAFAQGFGMPVAAYVDAWLAWVKS